MKLQDGATYRTREGRTVVANLTPVKSFYLTFVVNGNGPGPFYYVEKDGRLTWENGQSTTLTLDDLTKC